MEAQGTCRKWCWVALHNGVCPDLLRAETQPLPLTCLMQAQELAAGVDEQEVQQAWAHTGSCEQSEGRQSKCLNVRAPWCFDTVQFHMFLEKEQG